MKKIVMSMLLLCLITATAFSATGAENKISVVVDKDYPPYSYQTAEGAGGLYARLVEEVFSRCGLKAEVKALPWKAALKQGEEGLAAVAGIYKNKERLEIYDYSEPIFIEHLVIYVRKGQSFPFARLSDLRGRTVGINRSWSYGDAIDEARQKHLFTVEEADSNLENFKKLIAGRIDCVIADRIAASQIFQREDWGELVEGLEPPAAVNPAYLVFAKQLKKEMVLEKFNKALARMKKDGAYEKLIRDFVGRH